MSAPPRTVGTRSVLVAALVALTTTWALFAWVGDVNFNETEEGYLWYGVQRTAAGEVPIRDFQSYDPGRYYGSALLGYVFGHGVLGLRRTVACFQALGLFLGLLAARRALSRDWLMLPTALLIHAWMFPRHKLFESALALAAVFVGVRLLEHPDRRRHFEAGLFCGLAAFFGRNHGAYSAAGTFVLALALLWRTRPADPWPRLLAWAGGIVAGYAPMLLMLAFVPGFAAAFADSLRLMVKLGANIPYPWPWPWRLSWPGTFSWELVETLGEAVWFSLPPLILVAGLVTLVRTPAELFARRSVFLAGSVLGAFYIHHASVRSDPSHIAQSIDPLLLALVGAPAAFAWRRPRLQAAGWGLLALLSLGFVSSNHQLLRRERLRRPLVKYAVGGDTLRLEPGKAAYLARVEAALRPVVPADEAVFFAPSKPGFYSIFDKVAPTWWIYFFVPDVDVRMQREVIEDLEGVNWAFLVDVAIARKEREVHPSVDPFRFMNSNPLVWRYLLDNFRRVPTPQLPENHLLLRRELR